MMKNDTVLNCGTFTAMTTDEMMAVDGGSFWSWCGEHWKGLLGVAVAIVALI